eukprot:GHVO01021761.1.p1 GENE.GHVO01021761.1~~GHVO01021761.1.p1  ORF type:complete len:419 (-),score=73.82 GHVO01021761.1:273-1529(-)
MSNKLIRRIDSDLRFIVWNQEGDFLALVDADSFFILKYNRESLNESEYSREDGYENAFEVIQEVNEVVKSAIWVADCFVYVTAHGRLETLTAGRVENIAFLDQAQHIVGYYNDSNRLYIIDRAYNLTSYELNQALIRYESAVYRGDIELADRCFQELPPRLHNRAALFLEHQGLKEKALEITTDNNQQFRIALELGRLQTCASTIVTALKEAQATTGTRSLAMQSQIELQYGRWKQLGDVAITAGNIQLAIACFKEAKDVEGLFFIALNISDSSIMELVVDIGKLHQQMNIVVTALLLLRRPSEAIDYLLSCGRCSEAACISRTYCPSRLTDCVAMWNVEIKKICPNKSIETPDSDSYIYLKQSIRSEEVINAMEKDHLPLPPRALSRFKGLDMPSVNEALEQLGEAGMQKLYEGMMS